MPLVYRSVRLIILNATNLTLTVASTETVLGEWTPDSQMRAKVAAIQPQSAATFATQSTTLQMPTEAFLRLMSVRGPVQIFWSLPWIGTFALRCEAADGWLADEQIVGDDPAAITALLTLSLAATDR